MKINVMLVCAAVVAFVSPVSAEDAYIESDGSAGAGINTGFFVGPQTKIEIDFQLTTEDVLQARLFGASGVSGNDAKPECECYVGADTAGTKKFSFICGKSGGEQFTPQEVSEVLARLAIHNNKNIKSVYDPACGSGSLLLKFAKLVPDRNAIKYFGQELVPTNYNLSRINMFLHNINFDKFDIQCGNTLTDPRHRLEEPFDAIVSNPPYSQPWEGDANPLLINDDRYAPAGILAPKTKSDLAFTMHMLKSLSESGTAAIVEFPGVLYRGSAEQKIRQYLVKNNYVDTVIQLPANLFFGVSIATCIIVLRKSARPDNNILFIDASKLFVKDGNKNRLSPENQDAIVNAYADRKEVQYFTRLVSCQDVEANDYNLSVSSYVEQEDTREVINIDEVNAQLETLCKEGAALRTEINNLIATL